MTSPAVLAFVFTLLAGLSTTVGGVAAFFIPAHDTKFLSIGLGLSAGVMLYISLYELLPAGVAFLNEALPRPLGEFVAVSCFFGGMLVMVALDRCVHSLGFDHDEPGAAMLPQRDKEQMISLTETHPATHTHRNDDTHSEDDAHTLTDTHTLTPTHTHTHTHSPTSQNDTDSYTNTAALSHTLSKKLHKTGILTMIAIFIHNLPEGIASFITTMANPRLGGATAFAIAIHNIPEGLAVAIPIYYATHNRKHAFTLAFVSGISEPFGGLLGWAVFQTVMNDTTFGVLFSLIAGIMVFVSVTHLLPSCTHYDPTNRYTSLSLLAGFCIMAFSLILFQL
eukprot:TRINITY_DN5256_c1_g1_i1.p1 TRINITY_DN5256_c1_g1~~TRINITY_DN5256_c1_g1_i1.p1  ORF type:complete len:336 (+),score=106.33 TRINITY_DN5256_c1_g1_i1:1-1008(+)